MLPFLLANHRSENHQLGSLGQAHQRVADLNGRLLLDWLPTSVAVDFSHTSHQQSQIVIDFCDRADGTTAISGPIVLVDAQGRLQTIHEVNIGSRERTEKLPRMHRQRFHELPLALGVDRIERQRAFAAATTTGDDHQLITWNV